MISLPPPIISDEAAVKQVKEHADRLGIKLQLAFGTMCPSAKSFNPQNGTLEEQVARALRASQIFGATCMRCVLGGDPERPQIEMHIDNMVKAVRGMRTRIVDSGIKLAVENHGGDLQAREMKMMIEAVGPDIMGVCLDSGNPVWMLEDPHMTLEMLIPVRRDLPRPRQRRVEGARGYRRALGQHGRRQRRHRRLDPEVHRRPSRALPIIFENLVSGNPRVHAIYDPEVLEQLAEDAGFGVQPLPGCRREGQADAGRRRVRKERPPASSVSTTSMSASAIRGVCCSASDVVRAAASPTVEPATGPRANSWCSGRRPGS